MKEPLHILRRRKPKHRGPVLRAAFERPTQGGALAVAYPGYSVPDEEGRRRSAISGGLAALFHVGALGVLILLASLAPDLKEEILPVQLLKEDQPQAEEPAPAPKALAERRALPFNPAVQTVTPQIINPRVIAEASPAIAAEALQMDAVTSVAAPTQIQQQATVVERVSAVSSIAHARAAAVDVQGVAGPAVRGPVQVNAPVGPSVGPRAVSVTNAAPSFGTGQDADRHARLVRAGGRALEPRRRRLSGRRARGLGRHRGRRRLPARRRRRRHRQRRRLAEGVHAEAGGAGLPRRREGPDPPALGAAARASTPAGT